MHPLRMAWVSVLVFGFQGASAQNDENAAAADRVPETCISLNRVRRTDVIDDRTIIFHMRDNRIFLNNLQRECPGLKREERFMYSPTSNRLCDVDTVTVLENLGFGLTRGFTCALGPFHPISEVDLAELERGAESGGRGEGDVEVVPVDPDELEEALEAERAGDGGDDAEE